MVLYRGRNPKAQLSTREKLSFRRKKTLSRTWLTRRNRPAESRLGKGGEEGGRTENKRERERETFVLNKTVPLSEN